MLRVWSRKRLPVIIACAFAAACCGWRSPAALPSPERYLPGDTLFFVTIPDWRKFRAQAAHTPLGQCWNDPAMASFRRNLISVCQKDVVTPLQNALSVDLAAVHASLDGQVTLALTGGSTNAGFSTNSLGFILVADAGTNSTSLRELLGRSKTAGTEPRSRAIAGQEFKVLPFPTKEMPPGLRAFFPERGLTESMAGGELLIGVLDSALVITSSDLLAEHLTRAAVGTNSTVLANTHSFQSAKLDLEKAAFYAWANAETIFRLWSSNSSTLPTGGNSDGVDIFRPDQVIRAAGLSEATYAAFTALLNAQGIYYTLKIGAPKAKRRGLLELLASESKDASIPPFVFTDAIEFDRWRIDAQHGWTLLHSMFGEISPQWVSSINLILETANAAARLKDPDFDIQQRLFANLGDDLIIYEKASGHRNDSEAKGQSSLYLMSSSNPAELAASLQSILIFMTEAANRPQQRVYQGTTILSVPLPSIPLPGGSVTDDDHTLHYAATRGYVALTADVCLLEEFLRAQESPFCTLRDAAGVAEASAQVLRVTPAPGLFGYENRSARMRSRIEAWKRGRPGTAPDSGVLGGLLEMALPEVTRARWFDCQLLPPFEVIEKYFGIAVWSGAADSEALTWRFFEPTPSAPRKPQ